MAVPARQSMVSYAERLDERPLTSVDLVVVHCTELPDLAAARSYAEIIHYEGSRTGNCGHFYIARDGALWQYVPLARVAHHVAGLNDRSIGIELVNLGRYPDWHHSARQAPTEPYPEAQIDSLLALLRWLETAVPSLRYVAGHEDLDRRRMPASDDVSREIARKIDPGPLFPWDELMASTGLNRVDDASLAAGREENSAG